MTNWAQMFTGLSFYAYDGIHQMKTLVFDNYHLKIIYLKIIYLNAFQRPTRPIQGNMFLNKGPLGLTRVPLDKKDIGFI